MERSILLGVDGGGTKTDLFLFDTEGTRLGHLCAEGAYITGNRATRYEHTQNVLGGWIGQLCGQAGIHPEQIDSAVFGLAGLDIREEKENTLRVLREILPGRVEVFNDSMMGVLAAAPGGVGVCCACGTWTSVSGRNAAGETRQVSGIGPVSTESGGGYFVALEALRYAYSARYRDLAPTALLSGVLDVMELALDADLHEAFHAYNLKLDNSHVLALSRMVFQCAKDGDWAAQEILHTMAHTLAENTAGCVKCLGFEERVKVILSGSIWTKTDYAPLRDIYMDDVRSRVPCACDFTVLREAPALGAVLQAWRGLMQREVPEEIRAKIAEGTHT